MLTLLATTALKALLLLALAAPAAGMLRRAPAASRHLWWVAVVVVLLLLPLTALAPAGWGAHVTLPALVPGATAVTAPLGGWLAAALPWASLGAALAVLWLLGSLLLLVQLAWGLVRVVRRSACAEGLADPQRRAELAAAQRLLGVRRQVELRQDRSGTIPHAFGLRRPCIVLPAEAGGWPAWQRRAVLLHELAHVARRDWLWQQLAALSCVLYWPLPPVWWLARRLRLDSERACDAVVLAAGVRASSYAQLLLDFARVRRPSLPITPLLCHAQLSDRIASVLAPACGRLPLAGTLLLALLAALALVLAGLQLEFVRAEAGPPKAMTGPLTLIGPRGAASAPLVIPCAALGLGADGDFCRVLVLPRGEGLEAVTVLVRTPWGDPSQGRTELDQALRSLEAALLGWLERAAPEPRIPAWAEAQEYGL